MKIFIIKRNWVNINYDEMIAVAVVAKDSDEAIEITCKHHSEFSNELLITVQEIGIASPEVSTGILLESFNAG